MADPARVVIDVQAGLIPGTPLEQYGRRWGITAEKWDAAVAAGREAEALAELNGRALGYASLLMLQPEQLNWVHTDWLWL